MNTQQAKQWVHTLFTKVWSALDEHQLRHFYHEDVVACLGQQVAHFDNIVHRLRFMKQRHHTLRNNIQDIVVEGDKIAVRLEQFYGEESKPYLITAIYQLRDGKVSHLWACVNPVINYFES